MQISAYNLLIPQGTTLSRVFVFRHQLDLVRDILPGESQIRCRPLPHELPSGYRLEFPRGRGCETVSVLTSALAQFGAEVIDIVPDLVALKVPCTAKAPLDRIDQSGTLWRAAVRQSQESETPLLVCTCSVLDDLVSVGASAIATAELAANCTYEELPQFRQPVGSLQNQADFNPKIYKRGYYWDLERQNAGGEVRRHIYGRVFVPWESTR